MKVLVYHQGIVIEAEIAPLGAERKAHNRMLQRCRTRSIPLDPAWRSFNRFFLDVGRRPGGMYDLRRDDPAKPYGPGNCRWAPKKQTRTVSFKGKSLPITELAALFRISTSMLKARLKLGWPLEVALSRKKSKHYKVGKARKPHVRKPKRHELEIEFPENPS